MGVLIGCTRREHPPTEPSSTSHMTELIITVLLHAWGGLSWLDFMQPLFKNPRRRGKLAPRLPAPWDSF